MPEPDRVLTREQVKAMMRSEFLPDDLDIEALARSHEQLRETLTMLVEHVPTDTLTYEQARELARAVLSAGEETRT